MKLLTHFQQSWRIAEMRLLFLALLVSVTAVTSVNFFTDRTERSMLQQATKLLGADLLIRSSRPLNPDYLSKASSLGLKHAEVISFGSVVSIGDQLQLSQIKAVSENFPLRGQVETSLRLDALGTPDSLTQLKSSQAWAAPSLFSSLKVQPNATVRIGRSEFKLSKVLMKTPDQGANVFQLSPQVLIPLKDLPATGLLTPGSRARFSYLFAGSEEQVSALNNWLKPQLKTGERLETLDDGMPSVQTALQRAQRFLNTAALLSVILAGAAIALTSESFSRHETHAVAVLKTMGASRRRILKRYLGQLLLTATVAALLGAALGYGIQHSIALLLKDFIGQSLPQPSLMPILSGLLTAWVMMLSFSTPQLMQLVNTAPVQIFQNQPQVKSGSWKILLATILAGIFTLMYLQTRDLRLSSYLFVATLGAIIAFWSVAKLLLLGLKRFGSHYQTVSRTLNNAGQRLVLLVVVFGIGLFSLLLLTALRGDLLERWQNSLPDNAPNHFLINIQPQEQQALKQYLEQQSISARFYPLIRGRLVAMNGEAIVLDRYPNLRDRRLLQREFNLSSSTELPDANRLLEGRWFSPTERTGFSVEESIMQRFSLRLGDTLTFDIAGQQVTHTISSVRQVNWDNLTPNFFVLAAPDSLNTLPRTLITSIFVPPENYTLIPQLIRQHPSVSSIDIRTIMKQIKELIAKAAFAIQAIFAFTLIAGIVVLLAALQSQKAERRKELAILKAIGASRQQLRQSILIEFIAIGAIAGLLAGAFAVLASNLAAYTLFDLSPSLNLSLILLGSLSGAILVGVTGYLNLRPLLNIAPAVLFQEHSA